MSMPQYGDFTLQVKDGCVNDLFDAVNKFPPYDKKIPENSDWWSMDAAGNLYIDFGGLNYAFLPYEDIINAVAPFVKDSELQVDVDGTTNYFRIKDGKMEVAEMMLKWPDDSVESL